MPDGNSMTKSCYGWAYNDRVLQFKNTLVCFKSNGIFCCNEDFITKLKDPFNDLGIRAYVFSEDWHNLNTLVNKVLIRFYECATEAKWVDEIILDLVKSLNIQYEDKFIEYCRHLSLDQFRTISRKHYSRKKDDNVVVLDGLWYRKN